MGKRGNTSAVYVPTYFYHRDGYVEKVVEGEKMYRDNSMSMGIWKPLPAPIDRLLDHLQILTKAPTRMRMIDLLEIDHASISRSRGGHLDTTIPPKWLVLMADFSGLTLTELRAIGGLPPLLPRYHVDLDHFRVKEEKLEAA